MKLIKPNKETKDLFKKYFYECKKDLDPIMKRWKWSDITIMIWDKKEHKYYGRTLGKAFVGHWQIRVTNKKGNKRMRYFKDLIIINKKFLEEDSIEDIKKTFKHELCHIIRRGGGHDTRFNQIARMCGASQGRYLNKK